MLTLAFDTSTSFGSVAFFENEKILFEKSWLRERSHSEMLTSAMELGFQSIGKKPQDLGLIRVGVGPGSFTGIRVAINVARTLAYSLDVRVDCFDSFDILARACDPSQTKLDHLLLMIDAFNNEIFCARFQKINNRWVRENVTSQIKTVEKLESEIQHPHLCIGEAYNTYEPYFSPRLKSLLVRDSSFEQFPNAKFLGPRSEPHLLAWNEVQALYIKRSAAEEKLIL